MNQYIGIDISKEALSVFDGEKEYTFKNRRGLAAFKAYLHKRFRFDDIALIFEATGPYSCYLRDFCAAHEVRVWVVNPKRSASFAKAAGMRSKTDSIDARTLYALRKIVEPEDILVPTGRYDKGGALLRISRAMSLSSRHGQPSPTASRH